MSKFKELFEARWIVKDADTQVSDPPRTQPADTPKRRGRPPAMRSDPDAARGMARRAERAFAYAASQPRGTLNTPLAIN